MVAWVQALEWAHGLCRCRCAMRRMSSASPGVAETWCAECIHAVALYGLMQEA